METFSIAPRKILRHVTKSKNAQSCKFLLKAELFQDLVPKQQLKGSIIP